MNKRMIALAPLIVLAFLIFVALGGAVVQALWNWLLPPLFGWPEIAFWQALGLLALCRILFGGFGLHGSGRSDARRRGFAERIAERVAERVGERWEAMTAEERERFRQRLRESGGAAPAGDGGVGR
ncbi:MAG TPA: hypothetical protein VGC00_02965 [Thermoanaerobaculia bacterium]